MKDPLAPAGRSVSMQDFPRKSWKRCEVEDQRRKRNSSHGN